MHWCVFSHVSDKRSERMLIGSLVDFAFLSFCNLDPTHVDVDNSIGRFDGHVLTVILFMWLVTHSRSHPRYHGMGMKWKWIWVLNCIGVDSWEESRSAPLDEHDPEDCGGECCVYGVCCVVCVGFEAVGSDRGFFCEFLFV